MTNDELDRLEALAGAATAGPWVALLRDGDEVLSIVSAVRQHEWHRVLDGDAFGDLAVTKEDAAFLVEAREALPRLVAEVRRLRAEAEQAAGRNP